MNMVDISKQRYTTKHYDKHKKIPAEQIEALCTILQNSPSSVNSQPWHFIVVSRDDVRDKILPALADFNYPRVKDASHTIIMCALSQLDETYFQEVLNQEMADGRFLTEQDKQNQDKKRRAAAVGKKDQFVWESEQVYIALGNLLFAAAGMGIDSTAIGGFDNKQIDEILDLKAKGLRSVVMVTLGYRDPNDTNAKRPKSRLPKEKIFTFL